MKNIVAKFLHLIKSCQHEIFLGSCIILISIISYNLGQINSLEKTPISVQEGTANIYEAANLSPQTKPTQTSKPQPQKLDTRVVVSKNSDKYHHSWCGSWKRIKTENQIWFNSAEEAENRGYILAGNCSP